MLGVSLDSMCTGSLLSLLLPLLKPLCGECGKLITGQIRLTNGLLAGLSQLARSGPVVSILKKGGILRKFCINIAKLSNMFSTGMMER